MSVVTSVCTLRRTGATLIMIRVRCCDLFGKFFLMLLPRGPVRGRNGSRNRVG